METSELVEKMLDGGIQPSQTIIKLIEYENNHFRVFHDQYKGFVLHFEHCFELIIKLIYQINFIDKRQLPVYRSYQLLILKNSIGSIYSSFERLSKGFYVDALHCLRIPFESLIRVFYISIYPDEAEAVFTNKRPKGKRVFNLTNFLRDDLKLGWTELYSMLSMFSHSNNYTTLIEIDKIQKEGQKDPIQFRLEYDETFSTIPINLTYFILLGYLICVDQLFIPNDSIKIDTKLRTSLQDTIEAIKAITHDSPSLLKSSCLEYDKVFAAIKKKEDEGKT